MVWFLFFSLGFLWLIRTARIVLFYLYLWQLKEYHLGRFLDHFRTEKGRRILWHPLKIVKILALPALLAWPEILLWPAPTPLFFFLFYGGETALFFKDLLRGRFKKPVLTAKAFILISLTSLTILAGLGVAYGYFLSSYDLRGFIFVLLTIDILSPILVSIIVLGFQPLVVWQRNRIIAKAKTKRRKLANLITIGITGSFGKTSTKEFLATILAEKFSVLKTKEHQNSEIGIAQCILNDLKPEHQIFVVEMGAYGKNWIKLLCDLTKPKMGIITGVNEQHLALFGSMENLLSAEGGGELIESLPENGTMAVNWDNDLLTQSTHLRQGFGLRPTKSPSADEVGGQVKFKTLRYSALNKENADIWAQNIVTEKDYVRFTAISREGERADFKVNVLGKHNVSNLLGAALAAKELGMTLEEIARACEKIKPDQGPMKLVKSPTLTGKSRTLNEPQSPTLTEKSRTLNVIDSTYSANPDGVLADLEYLKTWSGKKAIIMPCLIELGPAAKEAHQKIGKKIAEICDLAIITSKDWFNELKESATAVGMKPENIVFSDNTQEILEKIKNYSDPEDIVLLEGRVPGELIKLLNK